MTPKDTLPSSVEVALDLPVFDTYHYKVPETMAERAVIGMRVLAPVGHRKITGYIVSFSEPPENIELREILDFLDETPLFDEPMLRLYRFLSQYLFTPLGEVIRGSLPAGINVESRQKVSLSETGVFARMSGLLRGPKGEILQALEPGKSSTVIKVLQKASGVKRYHIQELIREAFLTLEEELTRPRVSAKKEKVYRIVEGVSLARRSSMLRRSQSQSKVYRVIEEKGEITATQLRKMLGSVSPALRSLLRKGLLDVEEIEVSSDPFFALQFQEEGKKPRLTAHQQVVLDEVLPGLDRGEFRPYLLHGVTGSGKTELYLRIIEKCLSKQKQAIVLVPEIALTPQFVGVFRRRFGDHLAVLHSGLTARERFDQWWKICRQELPLVIGARSAIFAPFRDVGVIIVDEEHETSYKQEGKFPYHARNLALVRGKENKATVILGSATPAFESYFNAHSGKWGYLAMPERVHKRPMPEIEVIDMRSVGMRPGGFLSPRLKDLIDQNLAAGDQTILLLNRRGYHSSVICGACGHTFWCIHCSVSLTHHKNQRAMVCHYCGYMEPEPKVCPKCGSEELEFIGRGTEKVHDLLEQIFPDATVARMDRDTITGKRGKLEQLVEQFRRKEIDILLGTQMVAKGHDFPGVTLVGVLLADMGMNLPDFRSAERTFQLLMQVAGRAGRGNRPGHVAIQTFNPTHPCIRYVQQYDYPGFYKVESEFRSELGYPPFGWLVAIRFEGNDPDSVRSVAERLGQTSSHMLNEGKYPGVVFLGPTPAPIERIKSKFRWHMLFKSASRKVLHELIGRVVHEVLPGLRSSGVKITVDPDPVSML